jgi:deazaflavin-dependent oxidoreductase (nitroreductase family)
MGAERRYLRPGWLLRRVAAPALVRLGVMPVLVVRGRRSGRPRSVPVNVLELEGERYLVAPRGETEWVRNLRAAGECELRRRSGSERCRVEEVPPAARARLIQAYLERWGWQVRSQFAALPDPADHPAFRLLPR